MNQYLSNINKGKGKSIISLKKTVIHIIKKLHLFHIIKKLHKNSFLYKQVDPTLELREFNIIKTLIVKYGNNY